MARKQIATFLGPQLGISYLGEHAYAYSGLLNSGDSGAEVTFLAFQTGKEYIFGKFQFFYATDDIQGSDMIYRIKLNDQNIGQYNDVEEPRSNTDPHQPIPIVIPPLTRVTVTIASLAGAQQQAVMFTGRVYDV